MGNLTKNSISRTKRKLNLLGNFFRGYIVDCFPKYMHKRLQRKIDRFLHQLIGYKSLIQLRQILDYRRKTLTIMGNLTRSEFSNEAKIKFAVFDFLYVVFIVLIFTKKFSIAKNILLSTYVYQMIYSTHENIVLLEPEIFIWWQGLNG